MKSAKYILTALATIHVLVENIQTKTYGPASLLLHLTSSVLKISVKHPLVKDLIQEIGNAGGEIYDDLTSSIRGSEEEPCGTTHTHPHPGIFGKIPSFHNRDSPSVPSPR